MPTFGSQLNIAIDPEKRDKVKRKARGQGLTVNDLVNQLLDQWLNDELIPSTQGENLETKLRDMINKRSQSLKEETFQALDQKHHDLSQQLKAALERVAALEQQSLIDPCTTVAHGNLGESSGRLKLSQPNLDESPVRSQCERPNLGELDCTNLLQTDLGKLVSPTVGITNLGEVEPESVGCPNFGQADLGESLVSPNFERTNLGESPACANFAQTNLGEVEPEPPIEPVSSEPRSPQKIDLSRTSPKTYTDSSLSKLIEITEKTIASWRKHANNGHKQKPRVYPTLWDEFDISPDGKRWIVLD